MVNKFRSHFVDELETFTINIRFLCIRFTWFFFSSDNTFVSIIFRRRWNNLRITLVNCHRENLISNELLSDSIWDMHYSDYSQVVRLYSFSSLRFDTIRFGVTFLLCGYCYSQTLGKVVLNIIGKMKTLTKAKASIHGQQIFIVCTQDRRQFTIFSFSFWCVCFLFWLHALIILSKWMYGIEQVLGEAQTNSHSSLNTWNLSSQPTFTFCQRSICFLSFSFWYFNSFGYLSSDR